MKHRIPSIEAILEEMCDVKCIEDLEGIQYRLKEEMGAYLTPHNKETIEWYASISRVLVEHFHIQEGIKKGVDTNGFSHT